MELATNTRRTDAEFLVDVSFFIMLFTSFAFSHSFIGQAGILFFCGVMYLFMLGRRKIHFSYYFIFSIGFILYNLFLIREGISINAATSMKMTKTLMVNCVFAFVLYNYLVIRNDMKQVLNIFLKAAILFSLLMVLITRGDILSARLGANANVSIAGIVFDYNANSIAMISSFAYVVGLYSFFVLRFKRHLLCSIWLVVVVLMTGSRTGLLMITIGTALLIFLLYPQKRTRNVLLTTIILFSIYSAVMNVPWLYAIIGTRAEALLNLVMGKNIQDASMLSRLSYIHLGWSYFLSRPWTGYGLDCFRHLTYAYGTYSHNNYIEILFSGGVIGFLIYYLPNVIMYFGIFKKAHKVQNIYKVVFTMFLIQQAVEYSSITYFERVPLMMLILALSGFKLHQMDITSNTCTQSKTLFSPC